MLKLDIGVPILSLTPAPFGWLVVYRTNTQRVAAIIGGEVKPLGRGQVTKAANGLTLYESAKGPGHNRYVSPDGKLTTRPNQSFPHTIHSDTVFTHHFLDGDDEKQVALVRALNIAPKRCAVALHNTQTGSATLFHLDPDFPPLDPHNRGDWEHRGNCAVHVPSHGWAMLAYDQLTIAVYRHNHSHLVILDNPL